MPRSSSGYPENRWFGTAGVVAPAEVAEAAGVVEVVEIAEIAGVAHCWLDSDSAFVPAALQ